jgi:hypothetical protein
MGRKCDTNKDNGTNEHKGKKKPMRCEVEKVSRSFQERREMSALSSGYEEVNDVIFSRGTDSF